MTHLYVNKRKKRESDDALMVHASSYTHYKRRLMYRNHSMQMNKRGSTLFDQKYIFRRKIAILWTKYKSQSFRRLAFAYAKNV